MHKLASLAFLLVTVPQTPAQASFAPDPQLFSRLNTFSATLNYSNTSHRVILGEAQQRRLLGLELSFRRRLQHSRAVDWDYVLDLRPLTLIRSPVETTFGQSQFPGGPLLQDGPSTIPSASACQPAAVASPSNQPPPLPRFLFLTTCSTTLTYAGGVSPLGNRLNFATRHRLQPYVFQNAGILLSTRDLPINNSEHFNFTFEFGAGLELFRNPHRSHHQSWSLDYRLHHTSSAGLGDHNPGFDNQIYSLTYAFSR